MQEEQEFEADANVEKADLVIKEERCFLFCFGTAMSRSTTYLLSLSAAALPNLHATAVLLFLPRHGISVQLRKCANSASDRALQKEVGDWI